MISVNIGTMQTILEKYWPLLIIVLLVIAALLLRRRSPKQHAPQNNTPVYQSNTGEWTPDGWHYDKNTKQWEQPDYSVEDTSHRNSEQGSKKTQPPLTAEEKELAKQIKVDRKEPTFEEWKAQRKQDKEDPRS